MNVVPSVPSCAWVRDITRIVSAVWSSVSITTMFGEAAAGAARISNSTTKPAASAAGFVSCVMRAAISR